MRRQPRIVIGSLAIGVAAGALLVWLVGRGDNERTIELKRQDRSPEQARQTEPAPDFADFPPAEGDQREQAPAESIPAAAAPSIERPELIVDLEPAVEPLAPTAIEDPEMKDHLRASAKIAELQARDRRPKQPVSKPDGKSKFPSDPFGQLPIVQAEGKTATINRDNEQDDAPAQAARNRLNEACAYLSRRSRAWKVKKYTADWLGTEINGNTARVVFGGKNFPDCDVHLRYDAVPQKWKVVSVQGGGFPALPW